MKSSGLLKAVSISFFVTVTLSPPVARALHLDERSFPVPGTRLSMS